MAISQVQIGYGTRWFFESQTSPGESPITFTEMAEIKNVTPPNQQTADVDVTHNQSPGRRREFIPGLIDPGDASFEQNFVAGSTSDVLIRQLLTTGVQVNARIQFPNLVTWDFVTVVKGYEVKSETENAQSATITCKVSGNVVSSV